MMTLAQMRAKFPAPHECGLMLAGLRWKGAPICPYCDVSCRVPVTAGGRYHCNACNTNFSVTAKTIFARTRVDLHKWFLAIHTLVNARRPIPDRMLAKVVEVNKNTANYMAMRIRRGMVQDREFLMAIADELEK